MKYLLSLLWLLTAPAWAEDIDVFEAARDGDIAALTRYAEAGGNLDAATEEGYTPFILATYHERLDAARWLAAHGANPCATDRNGSNAMMGLAFKGYDTIARWMIEATDCPIDHQNLAGQTALMMASLFGRETIIDLLLTHGADPALQDRQGNTASSLAQAQGLDNIVEKIRFTLNQRSETIRKID